MEIRDFQRKLSETVALAKGLGNRISTGEIQRQFSAEGLSQEQLEKVYAYLKSQKIEVFGWQEQEKSEEEQAPVRAIPLNAEEEAYVRSYLASLPDGVAAQEELDQLLMRAVEKEPQAVERVVEHYLPMVVEIARELHSEQVLIADAISEGNIHLFMAVNRLTDIRDADAQLRAGIRAGILYMLEEESEQKRRDNSMVEKVARLEAAIKELTDEDERLEFSVDELSIFLDMPREEIEDILRLAGEE